MSHNPRLASSPATITRTVPTPAMHSFTYNGDLRSSYTSALNKQTTYRYDKIIGIIAS